MREKLLEVLTDIRPDVDFENERLLMDGGILDSFDIIAIVQEMRDIFSVNIDADDLEPYNFNTVDGMLEMIRAHRQSEGK
ncbi:MAG: acyl carrier protein [Lachnospiraceae bacterium]|nr:acyl carrier protein [Lachnospiraceae bacterium]